MLRTFHKYQKSVVLIFTAVIICGTMLFFGLTPYDSYSQRYAFKINGEEVSLEDYYRFRENLENNYRSQFGDFWTKLLELRGTSIGQEAQEQLINRTLLSQFAKKADLAVSTATVDKAIKDQFGPNLTPEFYAEFLARNRMSSEQFKASLSADLLPQEVSSVYTSFIRASDLEIDKKIIKDETEYTISYAEIDPATFKSSVTKPEETVLSDYFSKNPVKYLLQPKATYSYAVLKPADIINDISLPAEDIELYYADHLSAFTEAAQVKARKIDLDFNPEDIAEMTAKKEQADKIIADAKAGKSFEELVKAHSKNEADRKSGGDLGWVKKGSRGQEFDEAVFANPVLGNLVIVSKDNSIQIVLIEDYKAELTKKLEEVKPEIEKILKEQEGPAYARIKGQNLYDTWNKDSSKDLKSLATEVNIQFVEAKAYSKGEDPAPELRGLTDYVLGYEAGSKVLYEAGDNSILIEVKEVIPETQPEFKTVAEQVFNDYQIDEALKLAKAKAEELSQKLASADFDAVSKEAGLEVKKIENQKRTSREGILKNADINKAVFSKYEAETIAQVFEDEGKFYLLKVIGIKKPEQKLIDEKHKTYRERTETEQQNEALDALIRILKAKAEIQISPNIQGI